MPKIWKLLVVSLVVCALTSAGCSSDDDSPRQNNITPSNNGTSDVGDATTPDIGDALDGDTSDVGDAGDADPDVVDDGGDAGDGGDATTCPDTPCADDKICVEGSCVDVTPETKCSAAEDLGTLSPDSPLTASGTFTDASDALGASCADDTDVAEQIFRFEVDQDSRIDFDTTWEGNFAAVVDFRTTCDDATSAIACEDSDSAIGFVAAGTEVFLVVELAQGLPGDFSVELTASEESCPQGQRTCTSGELEICTGGSNSDIFSCADTCATGEQCGGDICSEAITVTQSQTFTGDLEAYASSFNFDGAATCQTAAGTSIPTPGADIVFELPNLTTSDTVTIDAETNDTNLNRIFILTDPCGAPEQCTVVGGSDEIVEFTPSADGTYYVVIDKSTTSNAPFEYSFTFD